MCSNLPPCEQSRQNDELLALIRQHAFDPSTAPADALIDIRDVIRQYDGDFADHE